MPRLPVPRLSDTIRGYLESVEPVLGKDEYECARLDALAFEKSASAAKSTTTVWAGRIIHQPAIRSLEHSFPTLLAGVKRHVSASGGS